MALILPAAVAILAFVAASAAAAAAVRRRLPAEALVRDQKPAGGTLMTAIAGIFGVMLAFVLTAALDRFNRAHDVASAEVNQLIELAALAEGFPAPVGDGVRQGCRDYFEAPSLESGLALLRALGQPWRAGPWLTAAAVLAIAAGLFGQAFPMALRERARAHFSALPIAAQGAAFAAAVLAIEALGPSGVAPFIYFQF